MEIVHTGWGNILGFKLHNEIVAVRAMALGSCSKHHRYLR